MVEEDEKGEKLSILFPSSESFLVPVLRKVPLFTISEEAVLLALEMTCCWSCEALLACLFET